MSMANGWSAWRISTRTGKFRAALIRSSTRCGYSDSSGLSPSCVRAREQRSINLHSNDSSPSGRAYACSCSRAEIQAAGASATAEGDEMHYPGWCRSGVQAPHRPLATRFRVSAGTSTFEDLIQGSVSVDVDNDVGDFVIRRRDGFFAYQLAVVVDDAEQGITHVVRGADLLASTPRQLQLQQALGLPSPRYAHLPLAIDRNGVKLSKSAGAAGIDLRHPGHELWRALRFLRQDPPADLRQEPLAILWDWAIRHWRCSPLRFIRSSCVEPVD